MATGRSLHLGVEHTDPAFGWSDLRGCHNDARVMKQIAEASGFTETTILFSDQVRGDDILSRIREAAEDLRDGDMFFLTFSGHGSSFELLGHTSLEPDFKDEAWIVHDRHLMDDELRCLWRSFQPGVRIAVVADACHSGTSIDLNPFQSEYRGRPKTPPEEQIWLHVERNRDFFLKTMRDTLECSAADIRCSVLLLAACMDHQLTPDGEVNGEFTTALEKVWNNGDFQNYEEFRAQIEAKADAMSTPVLFPLGGNSFAHQRPFTI